MHPVRRQLQAAWDLYLAMGNELDGSPSTERIRHIAISGFVRCSRLYRCTLSLVADGFGPEAEAMTRGMYEASLVMYWAMTHSAEAVERFDLHLEYAAYLNSGARSMPDPFEMEPSSTDDVWEVRGAAVARPQARRP